MTRHFAKENAIFCPQLNPPKLNRSVSLITSLAYGFGSTTELYMKTDKFFVRSCPCFKGVFSETAAVFSPCSSKINIVELEFGSKYR